MGELLANVSGACQEKVIILAHKSTTLHKPGPYKEWSQMGPTTSLLGQILAGKKWKKKPRGVNRLYENGSRRQNH